MRHLRSALATKLGPTGFYLARRFVTLLRYYGGRIYDRDLLFVRQLAAHPLLIDVGANAGQSALCMAMLRADARIVSFEANARNVRDLAFVRRILGDRYSYHHIGLSDRNGSATLHVPVVGRTPVPGESSFLSQFDSSTEDRIGRITSVVAQRVSLRTLDSFQLRPAFVKIDVQGHELEVLRGMAATLVGCRPVLLLEMSFQFPDIREYLRTLDYVLCQYDHASGGLIPCERPEGINYFAAPHEHHALAGRAVQATNSQAVLSQGGA